MGKRSLYITKYDFDRLSELLRVAGQFSYQDRPDLEILGREMAKAKLVDSRKIPSDVVTMNSKVLLKDNDTGEQMIYTLVFPNDADIDADRMSVLAPIGTGILGYSVGQTIAWPVPAGTRSITIDKILYQPEAAGDYDL